VQGLAVQRLTKRYDGVLAVDDISFDVKAGEFLSLLGPSGCGKTTTLRSIAGFERPDMGRIVLDGTPVSDAEAGVFVPPNKRRFGMVFQSYAVWPHMTVLDNVSYPLKVQGGRSRAEQRDRAMETLQTVGLGGYEARYPSQLSGGQQQRVALARALVMDPRLLLFDEPLSNLDAKLRERMRFELIEIQSKLGISAVYVTHDQAEAMVMSGRVIVMDSGHIAQEGAPEEIYATPRTRFVADFIGLSNFIDAEIVDRRGDGWLATSPLGELECVSDLQHSPRDKVLLAVRPERVEIAGEPFTAPNSLKGTLRHRYFLGPYSEYFIEVGGVVLRAQKAASVPMRPGEPVSVHIAPGDCRVVGGGPEPGSSKSLATALQESV
jgi:iron(III) transport system ATP-binding protein